MPQEYRLLSNYLDALDALDALSIIESLDPEASLYITSSIRISPESSTDCAPCILIGVLALAVDRLFGSPAVAVGLPNAGLTLVQGLGFSEGR